MTATLMKTVKTHSQVAYIPRNVDLIDARDLDRLLLQELQSDVLVEFLDMLVPFVLVQTLLHRLSLLAEEGRVAAKHEILALRAIYVSEAHGPWRLETARVAEHLSHPSVALDHGPFWHPGRSVPRIIVFSPKILHDLLILRRDCHGLVGVDRVCFEMMRERAQEQLVEAASLLHVEVVSYLGVSVIREVLGVVVDLKQADPISSGQTL